MGTYVVTNVNDGPAPFHVDAEEPATGNTLRMVFPTGDYPPLLKGTSISVSYTPAPPPEPATDE